MEREFYCPKCKLFYKDSPKDMGPAVTYSFICPQCNGLTMTTDSTGFAYYALKHNI